MSPEPRRIWTTPRKLVGNVIPLLFSLPFLALGIQAAVKDGLTAKSMIFLGAFLVVGWIGTALFGLAGNGSLKNEMGRRWHLEHAFSTVEKYFVGFARPTYKGLLDAHEDIGFLVINDDELEFFGSELNYLMPKSLVKEVRFRANPHTWLGLGRFVSVEGQIDGKAVRMLIEPRESPILIGNLAHSKRLRQRLREWAGLS